MIHHSEPNRVISHKNWALDRFQQPEELAIFTLPPGLIEHFVAEPDDSRDSIEISFSNSFLENVRLLSSDSVTNWLQNPTAAKFLVKSGFCSPFVWISRLSPFITSL